MFGFPWPIVCRKSHPGISFTLSCYCFQPIFLLSFSFSLLQVSVFSCLQFVYWDVILWCHLGAPIRLGSPICDSEKSLFKKSICSFSMRPEWCGFPANFIFLAPEIDNLDTMKANLKITGSGYLVKTSHLRNDPSSHSKAALCLLPTAWRALSMVGCFTSPNNPRGLVSSPPPPPASSSPFNKWGNRGRDCIRNFPQRAGGDRPLSDSRNHTLTHFCLSHLSPSDFCISGSGPFPESCFLSRRFLYSTTASGWSRLSKVITEAGPRTQGRRKIMQLS